MTQMEEQLERDTYITANNCPFCTKEFLLSWQLENHLKIKHPVDVLGFKCIVCNEQFTLRDDFIKHQQIHGGTYICNYCPEMFRDKSKFDSHQKEKHPNQIYNCSHCAKKFPSQESLDYHVRYHNPELKLKCQFCDQKFKRVYHLVGHERRQHTFFKQYLCAYCGKAFYDKLGLDVHNHMHEKKVNLPQQISNNRFKCKPCKKTYYIKFAYDNHMRQIHSKAQPYKCKFCQKTFSIKVNCTIHEKRHMEYYENENDNDNKKNILKCPHCEKTSINPISMDNHVQSHSDPTKVKCDECYDFCKPDYMRVHKLRVHRKSKPHTCDVRIKKKKLTKRTIKS